MQPLGLSQDTDTAQDEAMASLTASGVYRGPDLYEFLVESELHHYYNALTKDLKVNTVPQLKYVEEDDMRQIGMSKPEMRRLKKFFHKYCPQTYLRRIKKIIMNKKEDNGRTLLMMPEAASDKQSLRIPCKHMISADSITFNKELGSGEFGIVQQGVWTNEEGIRIQVAIKRLSKEKMQNNSMDFLKEASIMHTIDTEHIVRLYGVVLEADALMLVTELAPLRSLLECLKEPALRPSFPVISLCEFALQICDGMQYLESKRLIHRDLAARNILVYSKNKVKISDFGLSRALGVGKNYYQTNFNVNLKLPIAWCAPECINYLRFTSSSDVWAYGVTLWEMFSYGFQPWAALTGQQILEAIDEPNMHRLEQPECCPKEYYSLMLKCWQHDPNKRPKFQEILAALPELKPEQVLAIKDYEESSNSPKTRRDFLSYRLNEVIIVLDKRPSVDSPTLWKGVLNNGKTGLFNPANTVAYLGMDIPSMKPSFVRPDGKSGLYSSRRRIRPDMISRPQDDFKHTGHVGLDGAFFGDVSFLGDKYSQLPKQIVTPYKPHEDQDPASLMRTSDVSDRAPLIDGSKCGPPTNSHWTEVNNEKSNRTAGPASARRPSESPSSCGLTDHEYHEISEEEECFDYDAKSGESPVEAYFQKLDLGPSLMDEVFTALNRRQDDQDDPSRDEATNVRNEIKEITSRELSANGGHKDSSKRKHHGTVKPISPSDAKVIESAIAIANEMATRNMLEMDSRSESDTAQDSPCTPSSPTKRKFSFRFTGKSSSPRAEKRNFTDEAASIQNIQESITDSAKEAYNSLVEKRHFESTTSLVEEETNPLRMLRNGVNPVRPKMRGNKHGNRPNGPSTIATRMTLDEQQSENGTSQSQSMENVRLPTGNLQTYSGAFTFSHETTSTLPRVSGTWNSYSQKNCSSSTLHSGNTNGIVSSWSTTASHSHASENGVISPTFPQYPLDGDVLGLSNGIAPNLLPLPPRDRTKPMQNHKPRQRKHPLIIPTGNTKNLVSLSSSMPDVNPVSPRSDVGSLSDKSPMSPLSPTEGGNPLSSTETSSACSSPGQEAFLDARLIGTTSNGINNGTLAPAKPPRAHGLDDSFDEKIQANIDSLDDIPEEPAPGPPMYRNSDHVSCEDLLDFACDLPNVKRTQGRARGIDSDEVRIMQKVLKSEVTPEECVIALNETDWDVHKAIKYLKLQLMLNMHHISIDNGKQTLMSVSWDVQKAYNYLIATYSIVEDSTEV